MNFMGGRPAAGFYEEEDVAPSTRSDEDSEAAIQREHMFDKVVTPSDVGKLNRLVIPKQHAEKYFPLDSSSSSGEKGLLLNFEDRNGKAWRFRYSYWNSSQSYVMTKGWSRFVKDKKLDAGDIVSFHRGPGDRLFIDWRRRPDAPPDHLLPPPHHLSRPWSPFVLPQPPNYLHHHPYGGGIVTGSPCPPGSLMYLRPPPPLAGGRAQVFATGGWSRNHIVHNPQQMVFESVPVVQGKAAAKRLRLFGVNMDCPVSGDDINNVDFNGINNSISFNDCDMLLPSSAVQQQPLPLDFSSSSSSSSTLARFRTESEDGKGKGSMSLDLDI